MTAWTGLLLSLAGDSLNCLPLAKHGWSWPFLAGAASCGLGSQIWPPQASPHRFQSLLAGSNKGFFFWMFLVELKQKLLLWKVLKMFLFTYSSYAPLNVDLLFPSFKLLLFCTPFPVSDFEMNPSWLCESFPDKYESMVLSNEKIFLTFLGGTKCFLAAKCFQRKRY